MAGEGGGGGFAGYGEGVWVFWGVVCCEGLFYDCKGDVVLLWNDGVGVGFVVVVEDGGVGGWRGGEDPSL